MSVKRWELASHHNSWCLRTESYCLVCQNIPKRITLTRQDCCINKLVEVLRNSSPKVGAEGGQSGLLLLFNMITEMQNMILDVAFDIMIKNLSEMNVC